MNVERKIRGRVESDIVKEINHYKKRVEELEKLESDLNLDPLIETYRNGIEMREEILNELRNNY